MKQGKVITMKSEMKTTDQEHICSESEEVSYNFDDDNLGDGDDDFDDMNNLPESKDTDRSTPTGLSSKVPKRTIKRATKNNYLDDDEEEYSEDEENDNDYSFNEDDDDEDRKIRHRIYLRGQNEKYANALEKLSILDGKLNWLEKISIDNLSNQQYSNIKEYPAINTFIDAKRTHLSSRKTSPTGIKYHPTERIKVVVGKSTFIGLEDKKSTKKSNALCKFISNGAECKLGDQCRFSHEQINKLCNSVKEGKECKFGNRCKFLHYIETNGRKPDCKFGMKCTNIKCTFIHPNGKTLQQRSQQQRSQQQRSQQQRFNSPEQQKSLMEDRAWNEIITSCAGTRKALQMGPQSQAIRSASGCSVRDVPELIVPHGKKRLCKNMFKVFKTEIEEIGLCAFGDNCVYAHSKEVVKQNLEYCMFEGECKAVKIVHIIKNDKRVRRYENNSETRKCKRLHPNERVHDFITRIQHQPTTPQ